MAKKITRPAPKKAAVPVAARSRYPAWLPAGLLVLVTMLAYLPVWHAGFIMDDDVLLTANPLIKAHDGWYHIWFTTKSPDYLPVMSSVFWVEWRLWGMNTAGYHIVNVLLHAVNVILLWRLLARLKIPGALLAAAIFALHPVNVASVAWIAELKNTLSFFFFALSLLWYLKFDDTGRRRYYGLALGAFLLGLLSKIEVAPLPFVLLGIAWWRRDHVAWQDFRRTIPFFLLAFLLGLVSVWFQNHVSIGHDVVRTDSFWSRLAGAGWAVWFYFGKDLLPLHLIPIYPFWQIDPAAALSYVPGLLLVAALLVFWQHRKSWGRAPLFGLGYAILMLLPVLGFLNIYYFRYSLVADHWQYFSIVGPIALVAAGLTLAAGRMGKLGAFLNLLLGGTLLATLGVLTWQQASVYQTAETLWQTTVDQNPACWLAHNNLGLALFNQGEIAAATTQYQQAMRLNPDDAEAHINLGIALLNQGRTDEAISEYQTAIRLKPDDFRVHHNLGIALDKIGRANDAISQFQETVRLKPDMAEAHESLGTALLKQGQLDAAISQFQETIRLDPDEAEAHYNLGTALDKKGRTDAGISEFQKAAHLNPDDAVTHYNLGNDLLNQGRIADAISQFQAAIRSQPDYAEAHNNLGAAFNQQGQTDEAISQFQDATRFKPDYPDAHYNLGIALLNLGQTDAAISQLQETIRLIPNFADAHNNLGVALAQQNQIDAAISQFQDAIRLKPDYTNAQNNLTKALELKSKSSMQISDPGKP